MPKCNIFSPYLLSYCIPPWRFVLLASLGEYTPQVVPAERPRGRTSHAAPLTTRNLDGPRARAESGILCIGSILCSRGPTKPHINGRASHTPQLVQPKAMAGSLILPCGNLAPCGHLKKQGSFPLSGGGIGRRGEMFGKPRS